MTRVRANRRRLLGWALALAALVVLTLMGASGRGASQPPGTGPLPLLGSADPAMNLIGAAPAGEPGEAWGYRQLPLSVGAAAVGSRPLAFGPPLEAANPRSQLAFLRYTEASGWQVYATPVDAAGNPYRGPTPNRLSARITRAGGGVLVGRDPTRPTSEQVVVLAHDPGGPWRALKAPPATVLLPAEGERPAEALAADLGAGQIANAAFDESGHTGLFFAPIGRSAADGVIHYDGSEWKREPVEIPLGSETRFQILAIDATGLGNAWAIAEADEDLGRSLVLLRRTATPDGPLWVERPLTGTPFADRDDPGAGIAGAAPLGGAAQPLTVTSDGVWIDLAATIEGVERDVTLFYAIGAGAVTGSWCDVAALCGARPLGVRFSRQIGYRSFAWPGAGFGSRIVTNPLDVGGGEESNRGTYLRLSGEEFQRLPGAGGNFRAGGAFYSDAAGWLDGPVEISAKAAPDLLRRWPVSLRAPLTAATTAPGSAQGSLASAALAVGVDGGVARYTPGVGWRREFLLSSSGAVRKPILRGVAWPEPGHAYAVGDLGAMWQWNASDDLWIADPGIPIGFEGNLTGIAFDPAEPSRGFAVGKNGGLLRFGKSWEQEILPPGFAGRSFTSIAFAGREAIVAAGGDLLVEGGAGWHVDASAQALLHSAPGADPFIYAVAGLPDGGAVAAGRDIVIERDGGPGTPWRFSKQPIPGSTAIAAAAVRDGGVRAIVSVIPQLSFPPADDLPPPDPTVPPPILPPFALPGDGYLLRETANGWEDEQRTSFAGSGADRPLKSDPVLALLLDPAGAGWALGGWSGYADVSGRGTSAGGAGGSVVRARVRTASISRFGAGAAAAPVAALGAAVPQPAGPVRFAVAGHAACEEACADLAPQAIGPDRTLAAALRLVGSMRTGAGPRALLYTGNRVATGLGSADGARYAELLGSEPSLPVFPALGSGDVSDGGGAGVFQASFAGFPAPFGAGAAPPGISAAGIPGAASMGDARTHYAFDSSGPGGTVRVIVIDNSHGSLALSDPFQNPPEAQLPWLEAVLADARAKGIPTVAMGNRSLNPSFTPKLNVAEDGTEVARALVVGGASAYLFDRPEENRTMAIPAGAATTIPSFGTGTLGYRSQLSGVVGTDAADSLFGDSGVMLFELDASRRDPVSNRAPVRVRLIPVIQDLSLEATDGTLLRRSIPALFSGLGRRPLGGDRWGAASAGSGIPNPSGSTPYTAFPPEQCLVAGCADRLAPEYSFTSSDPDIADFVRQDPASTNLHKPYLDASDKVVTDSSSGLLCPFNAGTTTVTVSAGGFSYSEAVTVQNGSVRRPCGTRPLRPDRFKRAAVVAPVPPPPPPPPAGSPPVELTPPAPAPAPPSPPASPPSPPIPPTVIPPAPLAPAAFIPLAGLAAAVPAAILPPPPPVVRPLPPGGAPARTYQVEEKREEEAAIEESQAFSRYDAEEEGLTVPPYLLGLVLLAAIGAASVRGGRGGGGRAAPAAASARRGRF